MVSFSLRQRISYLLLQDPSPVSFHLSQFAATPQHSSKRLRRYSSICADHIRT
jgi:hypothetical protein